MPDPVFNANAARFHLKDGRPLIFQSLRPSALRRRAGEITLTLLMAVLGLIAATLFAKGRPESRPARPPAAASISARSTRSAR
jgi:hypothetical protein